LTPREELAQRCETIEQAYEYMLAYAAQGLPSDAGSQSGGQLREFLTRFAAALDDIGEQYRLLVKAEKLESSKRYLEFITVLDRDASDSAAAIHLALAQSSISSQLIDNLNASIHLRALLTDIFLIDEALKAKEQ
jgi:hypothetical protein